MRVRLQPLPVLSVLSALALALLIALGAWQWSRFEQRRLLREAPADVVTLAPFTPLSEGRQLVFAARDGQPGWRIFEPVRYGERTVFVDVGHVPGASVPDWRVIAPSKALAGARAVSGVAVRPRAGRFSTRGDPGRRIWYAVDLAAMAAAASLTDVEPYYVAMPYIGATGASEPNPFIAARAALPAERHFGYALTWWGLAAALVGVYLAFHARQGRLTIR